MPIKVIFERPSFPTHVVDRNNMQAMGDAIVTDEKQRIRSGYDVRGWPAAPLTKEYARRKGSSKPDMTLTGETLNDLAVVETTQNSVSIGFLTGRSAIIGATNNLLRHQLGVTRHEMRAGYKAFEKSMEKDWWL
jgi:glucose/arabinose dehydrogenase